MNLIQNEGETIYIYESLACAEISPKASNWIRWLRWVVSYPFFEQLGQEHVRILNEGEKIFENGIFRFPEFTSGYCLYENP